MLQDAYRVNLTTRIRALDRRAGEYANTLSPEELSWTPPDGGWSAAQVFEHLCRTDSSYQDQKIPDLIATTKRPAGPRTRWHPTLMGRMLVWSFGKRYKVRTFPLWDVGPTVRPDVIAAYRAILVRTEALMDQARGIAWRGPTTTSPVSAWLHFNLGDCFGILVSHAERHYGQIGRTLEARIGAVG